MPRKLSANVSFDDLEDDILYTRAAVAADPDAADLLSETDGWLALVDAARAKSRAAREAVAKADAARIVANDRLDTACTRFADELYLAVDKDRAAPRWTQFFGVAVSAFVRQTLVRQVPKVRAWLESSDPVVAKHKPALDTWSAAAAQALQSTAALALVRGEASTARHSLAEELTRERDGLHDALSARARERGLARAWPDLFFRTVNRSKAASETDAEPVVAEPAPPARG